ncbi:MAG: hypothetical protein ACREJT_10820, partial [Myxococcota bacterium]
MKNTTIAVTLISALLAAAAAGAAQQGNYDSALMPRAQQAPFAARAGRLAAPAERAPAAALPSRRGYATQKDAVRGRTTFLWLPPSAVSEQLSPLRAAAQPEAAARRTLAAQAPLLGLRAGSIDTAELSNLHDSGRGPLIARFRQMHDGVEVFGRGLNVMMDRGMKPLAVSGYFAPDRAAPAKATAKAAAKAGGFALDAQAAVAAAYRDLGIAAASLERQAAADGRYARFKAKQAATDGDWRVRGDARAKKVWYPAEAGLEPAYYVEVGKESVDHLEREAYGYVVSARDGGVLARKNQIASEAFSYRVWADAQAPHQPLNLPWGNAVQPLPSRDPAQKTPASGAATQLVTLDSGPIGSGDPWLRGDAVDTRGNNVDAYLDLDDSDGYT